MVDPGAAAVARELDGLPLALATAGAYLYHVATSFQDYLRLYKASWLKLQQTTPELSSYEDRQLYTTWQLSYDHIRGQNELSVRLLQLWAYFDNQDLWFELLREQNSAGPEWFARLTEDELNFHQAMRMLCNHGLAEADRSSEMDEIESTGYSMHSCVHEWTTHVLNQEWSKELARLSLYCVSFHVPDITAKGSSITQRRLMQHASRCWSSVKAGKFEEEIGLLVPLYNLGNLYSTLVKLDEAEQMFDRVLYGCQIISGRNETFTLNVVNSIGDLYTKQGKLMKAEKMYERAADGFEMTLGPNHPATLNTFNCLGILYRRLDKLGKAEKMYQRVLQGYKTGSGSEDLIKMNTANSLGLLYFDQRRLSEAEEMYLLALHGLEKALGNGHILTLSVVNNLGMLYEVQNKFNPAVEMYKRALQRKEKALGLDDTSTLGTVNNLGMLYTAQGKFVDAEEMLLRALRGKEKALGLDHTSTLNTVNNLMFIYNQMGRKSEEQHLCARFSNSTAG
jgi:tetratricopeptide (TPR) repeat protein